MQFWVGAANPNLGEGEAVGVQDGTVRKSIGEFLQALYSNLSSIFTRFRDKIFPLLCSSTPQNKLLIISSRPLFNCFSSSTFFCGGAASDFLGKAQFFGRGAYVTMHIVKLVKMIAFQMVFVRFLGEGQRTNNRAATPSLASPSWLCACK